MSAGRRIVAVLACHNRRNTTLDCLTALFGQDIPTGWRLEAVLVDDGSHDGTSDAVASAFPDVGIIRGDGNLWWGGAMALGLREAAKTPADLHLWLNDDVCLDRDGLAVLLSAWREGEIVVGATREPYDGTVSYGGQRRTGRHPLKLIPVLPDGGTPDCDTFQGNAVLIPAEITRRLGGIDAAFAGVQGMADTDFGFRARAAGIPIRLAPRSIGTCPRNRRIPPWRNRDLPLHRRLKALAGPRGFPLRAFLTLMRRHGGGLWPLWAASVLTHALLDALRPPASAPYRLAVLEGMFPRYRIAQLQGLAERPDLRVTVYLGRGLKGWTAESAPAGDIPLPSVAVRNRFWPFGGGRRLWTGGTFAALGSADTALMGLHTHDLAVWAVWLSRRLRGRPKLLLSGHFDLDYDLPAREPLRNRLRRFLRIFLARGADAVLPYTAEGAESCLNHGIPRSRIHTTHNSVDTAAIRSAAAAVTPDRHDAALRTRYDLPAGPLFLAIGRLYGAKRFDLALEAMALLRNGGRDCGLLVVGDGPERAQLEAAIGPSDGVRFAGALFEEDHLAPLFAQATALILPGAAGLAVLHAFAYGVPVIACRGLRHGPEIAHVQDGRNGLLTATAAAAPLAASMARLLDDATLQMQLSRGARATADTMSAATWVHSILGAIAASYDAHRR